FDVSFELPASGSGRRTALRYTGTVVETVEAAILVRPLNRGEVVKAADIAVERRPKAELGAETVGAASQATGLAARRPLRAALPRLTSIAALALWMGGCSALDRLKNVGEPPALAPIASPTAQPAYRPVHMPMPTPQPVSYNPNSLWRNGSRAFFKDQRAHQVGDILTVKVKITDKAKYENETTRTRSNKEDSGVTDFIGSKLIKNPS